MSRRRIAERTARKLAEELGAAILIVAVRNEEPGQVGLCVAGVHNHRATGVANALAELCHRAMASAGGATVSSESIEEAARKAAEEGPDGK